MTKGNGERAFDELFQEIVVMKNEGRVTPEMMDTFIISGIGTINRRLAEVQAQTEAVRSRHNIGLKPRKYFSLNTLSCRGQIIAVGSADGGRIA